MNTTTDYTVSEKILLAAYQLEEETRSSFTAEALVVATWKMYPQAFGLRGFEEQHPDSNKVLSSIMGEKGLVRRGWLSKMSQKVYALTRDGRLAVRRLQQGEDLPRVPSTPAALPAEMEKHLQGLLASTAYQKLQEHGRQAVTFPDACRFWNITENLRGTAVDEHLDRFDRLLVELERRLHRHGATLTNGRFVPVAEIDQLAGLHDFMKERFSRGLALYRNRSERN